MTVLIPCCSFCKTMLVGRMERTIIQNEPPTYKEVVSWFCPAPYAAEHNRHQQFPEWVYVNTER